MANYKQLLDTLKPEQKIEFFEKILSNSETIQNQLIAYFSNKNTIPEIQASDFEKQVQEMVINYQRLFEQIDLEDIDYDRWNGGHGRYYEEWEIAQEVAQEEIGDLFDSFMDDMAETISNGDLKTFLVDFTGLLIACFEADIDDPNDNLGDPNEYLVNCFSEITDKLVDVINRTVFNQNTVSESITNVLNCFAKGGANEFDSSLHDRVLNHILERYPKSSVQAINYFTSIIITKKIFPLTYLTVLNNTSPDLWINEAVKLAPDNVMVAKNLLIKLSETSIPIFYENAKKLFPLYKSELVNTIAQLLDLKMEKNFAKEVLSYKVIQQNQMEDYVCLSALFADESEKAAFLIAIKSSFNISFFIKVLEWEKKFGDILEMAQNSDKYFVSLEVILSPILSFFPDECFKIASEHCENKLINTMGRNEYAKVASLLKLVSSNKDLTPKVNGFIKILLDTYSRRPALKDELKQAKLI